LAVPEQRGRQQLPPNTYTGLVVATHGRHCWVEREDGSRVLCYARSKQSAALVGDQVHWAPSGDGGILVSILPRRNCLYRQDAVRTKAFAANIDNAFVLLAAEPKFSETQLAHTLTAIHSAGVQPIIGLNKSDLTAAFALASKRLAPYRQMGYPVLELCLTTPAALETSLKQLAPWCSGKTTLVLGPSGSGKSTFINAWVPQAQIATQAISTALGTGCHTTTACQWYWADQHTALVDSPGFTCFGLHHLLSTDIARYWPDFQPWLGHCRFYNCTHVQEPGCAILAQVGLPGGIEKNRHAIYVNILQEMAKYLAQNPAKNTKKPFQTC
jgi:ribosome biogenesis GTPase